VVTVTPSTAPDEAITIEDAESWRVALYAAAVLRDHFPDFYTDYVAEQKATCDSSLGICCALWLLAEQQHGIVMHWPSTSIVDELDDRSLDEHIPHDSEPADCITFFSDVSPEYLGYISAYVEAPVPMFLGLNIQSRLSGNAVRPGLLQALIWHLLRQTDFSIATGAELDGALEEFDPEDRIELLSITPLPVGTPIRETLSRVARNIPEAHSLSLSRDDLLLRYAVGQTGNPLADTGMDDLR
jgi:hypothetical protein